MDLRCFEFLRPARCASLRIENGTSKAEVTDFINVFSVLIAADQDIFWLDISMDKLHLVDASQSLHDVNKYFHGLFELEGARRQRSLITL